MTQAVVIPLAGADPELLVVPDGPLELVAAELLPLDLQVAAGGLPSVQVSRLRAGQVAVARDERGALVSVQGGRSGLGLGAAAGTFACSFDPGGSSVVLVPPALDPLVAAAGVSSVIAARLALQAAQTTPQDVVLVVGARGAVGSAAADIARSRGCQVLELTRENAADVLGGEPRPDVVVDCVGGPLLIPTIRAAGARARHVIVGYVGDGVSTLPLPLLLVREHRLLGLNVYATPAEEFDTAHREALEDLAAGVVTIPGERLETVPLTGAREAYRTRRRVLLTAE